MAKNKRLLYVVSDEHKLKLLGKLQAEQDNTSIIVVPYLGLWDYFIPDEVYAEYRECINKLFDSFGDWFPGNSEHYQGYFWARDVRQRTRAELGRFLSCMFEIYDEVDYPPKHGPPKPKTPQPDPPKDTPPSPSSRKRSWKDQPDWKKRAGGDYD